MIMLRVVMLGVIMLSVMALNICAKLVTALLKNKSKFQAQHSSLFSPAVSEG
jgi:hypothetical protein